MDGYIQTLLPTHYRTLVDVFGGSDIITLNTAVPKGCLQIYNDLNHDLYNLIFCVKYRPMALTRELNLLPINAHDEFDILCRRLRGEDFTLMYLDEEVHLAKQGRRRVLAACKMPCRCTSGTSWACNRLVKSSCIIAVRGYNIVIKLLCEEGEYEY